MADPAEGDIGPDVVVIEESAGPKTTKSAPADKEKEKMLKKQAKAVYAEDVPSHGFETFEEQRKRLRLEAEARKAAEEAQRQRELEEQESELDSADLADGFYDQEGRFFQYDELGNAVTFDELGNAWMFDERGRMVQAYRAGESPQAGYERRMAERSLVQKGLAQMAWTSYFDDPGEVFPEEGDIHETEVQKRRRERNRAMRGKLWWKHPWEAFMKKRDDNLWLYEKMRLEDYEEEHLYPWSLKLVQHPDWDKYMGLLIMLNCLTIVFQAVTVDESGPIAILLWVCENLFTLTFLLELAARVRAYGWGWMFESVTNFVDAILVFFTGVLVTWVLAPAGIDVKEIRKFTLLRIVRLYRLVQALRLDPAYREMWFLVKGMIYSMSPLFWSLCVISFMLFLFGVTATQFIGRSFEQDELAQKYFGSVMRSMFTLFQITTLDSWDEVVRPLEFKVWWFKFFIFFYFATSIFVVMNLVIAVIVENVFVIAKEYEVEQEGLKDAAQKRAFEELKALFQTLSDDGRVFYFPDFWTVVNGKTRIGARFRGKLKQLNYTARNIKEVKALLVDDADEEAEVDLELFCYCLKKIRHTATAQDILVLQKAIVTLEQVTTVIEIHCNMILESLDALFYEVQSVDVDLNLVIMMVGKVMDVINHILKGHEQRKENLKAYQINLFRQKEKTQKRIAAMKVREDED
ncbi:unnamed protein product [Amoebophrya sp. A25]|nr:unnamed protein product [Amoebophrya sp. A25]|eukprot:GSA25T00025363001.1